MPPWFLVLGFRGFRRLDRVELREELDEAGSCDPGFHGGFEDAVAAVFPRVVRERSYELGFTFHREDTTTTAGQPTSEQVFLALCL